MMNNMSQGLGSFNMTPQNTLMQQNPYGQQMNPQMMGQQMRSPEMFSEQLMAPNQMAPMQDPMQGLQPMSQPAGFGVYGQSLEGYAEGGEAVPRETEIMGQPHMLAYINPEEEMMLRQMGGSGDPGPGGVPSFAYGVGGAGSFQGISEDRRREMRDDRQATERAQSIAAPKTGIMGVVDDVKAGFKNLISDVGMTYAGGLGSFSDLNNQEKYNAQYNKLVNLNYDPAEVTRYLDTTKATQAAIRKDMLDGTITDEERAIMKDERLADEARLASTAVGTGIDTIPISTSLPSGSGTVGTTYGTTGGFTPSSDFNPETGEFYSNSNTYGQMDDGSLFYMELINGQPVYRITQRPDLPDLSFDNYQEAYSYATGTPYTPPAPVMPPPSVTPPPIVTPDPIVAPPVVPQPTAIPAATVDPMTPVGGGFLLPGQQNFGPTPAAALNFNPNTYMQTPQNANVALPEMFQQARPYTFEELLSQYKPAYPVNQ